MSMLSVMCERLRNIADNLSANGYTDTVKELRDAADVIDDLRRKCQDVQAENAKLRELVSLMDKRDVLLPCGRGCDADCRFYGGHCERIGTLMGELGFKVES